MKKIVAIVLLFVSVNLSAQADAVVDTSRQPAITAIGKPDGAKAEMKIGKDGGTFTSSDGKVNLTIPQGAVSKKTTFSIQPVTNLMPNGNGKAYRLEPSGIQFQKPVQLLFHYDPEESEDSMQLLMGMAMQDDNGQWYGLNEFTLDTVAKTISGNINHFSIWATFDKLKLISSSGNRIKVKKMGLLFIRGVDARTPEEREQDRVHRDLLEKSPYREAARFIPKDISSNDLSSLSISSWAAPEKVIWRVNNIIKGSAEFGTLEKGMVDESHGDQNKYTAPANVPDENPVTISVELVGASFKIGGRTVKNPVQDTKILIYDDAYEVKMVSSYDGPSGTLVGNVTYTDTGSFVVSLNGKKPKIIERVNRNSTANLGYSSGSCTITLSKPGRGNIHILEAQYINVIPATATQPKTIVITFPRTPVILPLLDFICPNPHGGPTIGNTAKSNEMAAVMPAFPMTIRFTAVEEEQVIALFGSEHSELYFKCTVKRMDQFD